MRGHVVIAAVAAGAFTSAGQAFTAPPTSHEDVAEVALSRLMLASGGMVERPGGVPPVLGRGGQPPALEVLPLVPGQNRAEVRDLAKGAELAAEREAREAAEAAARRPDVVSPTNGIITSSYGPRWGTTHYGLDIANDIGTPILSVMSGEVIDAGPASGFGLWVRVLHDDGTMTLYGHINQALVDVGQRVEAGEEIAEMGNRGFSTGPHLHFEVHSPDGEKLSPQAWLEERGAMEGIVE
jgi:murein DD-endopeptidase MepM/ murein hydrolase activator NlpD